jgi:ammonia channel protein AmtB
VVFTVPLLDKLKIDDVVGAIPVHLFAGIWGTLVVPLSNTDANLGTQIIGIAAYGAFTVVTTSILWFILKAVMGVRVLRKKPKRWVSTRPKWVSKPIRNSVPAARGSDFSSGLVIPFSRDHRSKL